MRQWTLGLTLAVVATLVGAIPSLAQPEPEFRLGFAALAQQIPEVAGQPLEEEHWGANGDSLQQTTKGLMVWRKADNWTAFTNGSRTWINGPQGVQDRPNDQRFEWEAQAPSPAATPSPAPATVRQPRPIPSARSPQLFRPTDILVHHPANWDNPGLAPGTRTHAAWVGSTHQPFEGKLSIWHAEALPFVRQATDAAHRLGLKYIQHFTSDSPTPDLLARSPNIGVLDLEGKPITTSMGEAEAARPWLSLHSPEVKQHVLQGARNAVDSGIDVLSIDGWTMNYDVTWIPRFQGDFSQRSLDGFRTYLAGRYAPEQLASLGIQDIGSFDYGQYIRENHLAQYRADRQQVPLFKDFEDFQLESSRQFWSDVMSQTRAYAQQSGRKISFVVNVPESESATHHDLIRGLPIADLVDAFVSEYNFSYTRDGRTEPVYKLYQSLGKPAALQHNSGGSSWQMFSRPDVAELTKVWTAEAYASGGFAYVPRDEMLFDPSGWKLHSADLTGLYPYYDFINSHPQYYEKLLSAAKTAVLYSYASVKADERLSASFFGISRLLLDTHRQYDVLFAGDGRWIEDKLTSDDLNPYDVVILPGVRDLSDRQIDLLLAYVEGGGNVLAFGETGTRDEANREKPREQIANLLVPGSHQYGQGQFIYLSDDVGARYLSGRDAATQKQVVDALNRVVREEVRTNAGSNVGVQAYLTPEGSKVVHLINYDYDLNARRFIRQPGMEMEVSLGNSLSGKELAVFYSSPDGGGVQELKYSLGENSLRFQVPGLDTYGVLFVGERSAFRDKVSG